LPVCEPTVLIGGIPAARVGDLAYCNAPPDVIAQGSPTVLIGGRMAARMGDLTAHGGVIVVGDPTVLIGDSGGGTHDGEAADSSQGESKQTAADNGAASSQQASAMPAGDAATPGARAFPGQQKYSNCGLQAVNQILYLSKGSSVDETALLNGAIANGLAEKGATPEDSGGTTATQRMKILSYYGIPTTKQTTTESGLENAIKNGQASIVSVNGGTIFTKEGFPDEDALWGSDHVVTVTGGTFDANGQLTAVAVNDTGTGVRKLIPTNDFMDAVDHTRSSRFFGLLQGAPTSSMIVTDQSVLPKPVIPAGQP